MPRRWLVLAGFLSVWAFNVQSLMAAEWPPYTTPFARGPGGYFSVWKLALFWLLFLAWVYTSDWINQDCLLKRQNYGMWNSIVVGAFMATALVFWFLPWFFAGWLLMLVAWVAPLATYIVQRNAKVDPYDRVLTKQHLRHWIAHQAGKVGIKIEAEEQNPHRQGPDLHLKPQGGATERDDNVHLLTARQSPGLLTARELLFDALGHNADGVMLDYGAESVAVRYLIDGVWHNYAPLERVAADPMLAVMKTLSALNMNERRVRQLGSFGVETAAAKYDCRIATQGTQGGERAILQLGQKKLKFDTLDDLGMRPKMQEQLEALLRGSGFFLVSSLPGDGLTTTIDTVLRSTDKFTRHFVGIEDAAKREREIENLSITTYDAAGGETPASVMLKLVRTYPDVIVLRDLVDAETVRLLCQQVSENRLVVGSIRAKEAVEALIRVLLMKVPGDEFGPAALGVLYVRLVRKLCEKCKEAYRPPEDVVKQLGLPPGRVEVFYRPPTEPIDPKNPEKVCEECNGIGYRGRTGIFELLSVDDAMRQLLATNPKLESLKAAARKARNRSLREEGLVLVIRGTTSLPELMRVLKK